MQTSLSFFTRIASITCLSLAVASSLAAAPPQFAIAAANVTMPSTGLGPSAYTVTGPPITGTLAVTCQYSGPATEAKIPDCSYGPIAAAPVTAGETVSGIVYFYPYGAAVPLAIHRRGQAPPAGLALAGALLLGLGLRRRMPRGLALILILAGGVAGTTAVSACGGSPNVMTPGTYQYNITAGDSAALNPLTAAASNTVSVTAP